MKFYVIHDGVSILASGKCKEQDFPSAPPGQFVEEVDKFDAAWDLRLDAGRCRRKTDGEKSVERLFRNLTIAAREAEADGRIEGWRSIKQQQILSQAESLGFNADQSKFLASLVK